MAEIYPEHLGGRMYRLQTCTITGARVCLRFQELPSGAGSEWWIEGEGYGDAKKAWMEARVGLNARASSGAFYFAKGTWVRNFGEASRRGEEKIAEAQAAKNDLTLRWSELRKRSESLILFSLGGSNSPCHENQLRLRSDHQRPGRQPTSKGHLIPDQEWFPVCDGIDAMINEVAARRTNAEAAAMRVRSILITAARLAYQCRECGRLFVDDRQHQLHTFAPASTETSREILRSRDGHEAT